MRRGLSRFEVNGYQFPILPTETAKVLVPVERNPDCLTTHHHNVSIHWAPGPPQLQVSPSLRL